MQEAENVLTGSEKPSPSDYQGRLGWMARDWLSAIQILTTLFLTIAAYFLIGNSYIR
jgi:hypothetical protein